MILGGKITNPGELRTQIKVQKRTETTDAGGFQAAGWTDLATVYAKWTNVHGSEVWQAESVGAEMPATVLIRYIANVDTTCRVSKGGLLYEVVSVDNIQERSEYLELKVKAVRAG